MRLYNKLKLKCTSMYTNKGFTTIQEKQKPTRVNYMHFMIIGFKVLLAFTFMNTSVMPFP